MEKNKIIVIGLIVVIVVLAAVLGVMMLSPHKEATELSITSNSTIYSGDNLSVELKDSSKAPIANEFVNIVICDSTGKVVTNETVRTDSGGNANLALDLDGGSYDVTVSFGGNANFTGNSTSQNLEIKEEAVETQQTSSTQYSSESSSSQSSSDSYGPEVDSGGITREEAEKYGFTYTSEHGGHYIGSHDAWDEEAGMYHD